MKKIKLLFYDFDLPDLVKDGSSPIGGATVELYAWIKGLEANNCEVGVLTRAGAKEYVGNNTNINFIEAYDPKIMAGKLWSLNRYRLLYKAIKKFNPDYLIQECAGIETGIMAYIGKKLSIPFVYRVANDIDTDDRINKKLKFHQRILFKYGLRNSSAIFCQNNYQFEKIMSELPNKKLFIIHIPYYNRIEFPRIKKYSERTYIAWMATFQYQKNLPLLYNIVKKMPNILFKIAGRSKSFNLDRETKYAVEGLKQCNNVEFMGQLTRKKAAPFLAGAYALLNTSHYEGFPLSYLDALAVGTPIITKNENDPDDFISINRLGAIGNNYSELEKLINKIINDSNYNELIDRCRLYVMENHNTENLSRKFIENLQKINIKR